MQKTWTITSLDVVWCEGWYVKASMTSFGIICLVMYNDKTKQCHTRFFDNERQANKFVERLLKKTVS
jgi:hypothetical protein